MRADPKLAKQASPETIERNHLLIAALDEIAPPILLDDCHREAQGRLATLTPG